MIQFPQERWGKLAESSRLWWEGRLGRPLIQLRLSGLEPERPAPRLGQVSCGKTAYAEDISPDSIIDFIDYKLGCFEYLGDSFPHFFPDFGPGVLAAFLGCRVRAGSGTVWFCPPADKPPGELSFEFNANNPWFERIKNICGKAMERWEGFVQVGMTDLGGVMDVLSTFRPGEKLLLDLYDSPGEVKRLVWEIHNLWWAYYGEINRVLRPLNPGYTAWTPIFSPETYYILQCDFASMLGPDMFAEFVRPEIEASAEKLGNSFFHLDGPGMLVHLDSLLGIDALDGIQWVPGEGSPGAVDWPEVYRKIRDSGKLIQLSGGLPVLDEIASRLGSCEGIVFMVNMHRDKRAEAVSFLERYGVEMDS